MQMWDRSKAHQSGLVRVDKGGFVMEVLHKGDYHDVCIDGELVYGLQRRMLTMHKQSLIGWTTIKEIKLDNSYNTLCISSNLVTLGARNYYNASCSWLNLDFIKFIPFHHLQSMYVLLHDSNDNVLLSGNEGREVCILSPDATYRTYSVPVDTFGPLRDVTVCTNGDLIILCEQMFVRFGSN